MSIYILLHNVYVYKHTHSLLYYHNCFYRLTKCRFFMHRMKIETFNIFYALNTCDDMICDKWLTRVYINSNSHRIYKQNKKKNLFLVSINKFTCFFFCCCCCLFIDPRMAKSIAGFVQKMKVTFWGHAHNSIELRVPHTARISSVSIDENVNFVLEIAEKILQ